MTTKEIDQVDPSLRVSGRDVKLLVCNEPKGILSDSKRFMAGVSVMPPRVGASVHEHEAEELYFVLEGSGEIFQGGETRKIGKGSAIFLPSHVKHGIVSVRETTTLLWIMSPGGKYPFK